MRVTVLTALPHAWETAVVEAISALAELDLVRRCADLPELLSTAAAGLGQVALVAADLTGLDATAVAALRAGDVRVVGMVRPGDAVDERRLRGLGVSAVLPADADADRLREVLTGGEDPQVGGLRALYGVPAAPESQPEGSAENAGAAGDDDESAADEPSGWRPRDRADPRPVLDPVLPPGSGGAPTRATTDEASAADERRPGRVIAVWGPAGAPGRSTVALGVASECARAGGTALLIDADPYGGVQAQALALLDEAPGLAGAVRLADQGGLDAPGLAQRALAVAPGLSVLTGLPRADRWPELRPDPLQRVLELSRLLADLVVVDCGFSLEDDEELSYDTAAPRRNAATLTALADADHLLVVGAGEPVGLQRLVRGLQELGTVRSPASRTVVVNRVRASAVGPRPEEAIGAALERFVGLSGVRFIPDDRDAFDLAALQGRTLAECAPSSPARLALAALAADLRGGDGAQVTRISRRRGSPRERGMVRRRPRP